MDFEGFGRPSSAEEFDSVEEAISYLNGDRYWDEADIIDTIDWRIAAVEIAARGAVVTLADLVWVNWGDRRQL
jgi:hypothetical protein